MNVCVNEKVPVDYARKPEGIDRNDCLQFTGTLTARGFSAFL